MGSGDKEKAQVQRSAGEKHPGWDARGMWGHRRLDPPGRATKTQISPAGTELTPMLGPLLPPPKPLASIRDSQETVEPRRTRESIPREQMCFITALLSALDQTDLSTATGHGYSISCLLRTRQI